MTAPSTGRAAAEPLAEDPNAAAGDTAGGAKHKDYWWTVLAVDPLAIPLTGYIARRRLLTPDQVTLLSAVPGVAMGIAFASGGRAGLVVGAALFYVSFLLDCIDGKLARRLRSFGTKGKVLDQVADGARRASGSIGLAVHLWRDASAGSGDLWWGVAYGFLAFLFATVSGGTREEPGTSAGSRWERALARKRLLPTPGTPDVAALVFFFGPLTGFVLPALVAGCALLALGMVLVLRRLLR